MDYVILAFLYTFDTTKLILAFAHLKIEVHFFMLNKYSHASLESWSVTGGTVDAYLINAVKPHKLGSIYKIDWF